MEHAHVLYAFQEADKRSGNVTLTGETAGAIVEGMGFERQRHADLSHIANLKEQMDAGDWFPPSTLTFAINGDGRLWLVDGQHRLRAFVEHARVRDMAAGSDAEPTAMPWHVEVVEGSPAEVYAALDSVARNRSGAVIGEALALPVPPRLLRVAISAAAKALAYSGLQARETFPALPGKKGGPREVRKRMPIRMSRGYIDSRKAAYAAMGEVMAAAGPKGERDIAGHLARARVLPVCLETLHAAPEEADAFWRAIVTGQDTNGRWPVVQELRVALAEGDTRKTYGAVSFRARMCAAAWNARNGGVFNVTRTAQPTAVEVRGAEYDGRKVRVLP